MLHLFAPTKWMNWQSYIAITSTILAGLGIYFGALLPFIDWLNEERALGWFVLFVSLFGISFIFVHREAKRQASIIPTRLYASKIVVFGFLWSSFPYLLCSSSLLFKGIDKDCLCAAIPPVVEIALRKDGAIIQVADEEGILEILERTKNGNTVVPEFRHPDDIQRVLDSMRKNAVEENTIKFMKSWDAQMLEVKTSVLRLLADFSSSPLAPSEFSEKFYERLGFQIAKKGGMVILSGDEAFEAIEAMIESDVSYEPVANEAIIGAVKKYLSLRITKLYGDLKFIPKQYTDGIDKSFIEYIKQIPFRHYDVVKLVAYPDEAGEFRDFECGSPEKGPRKRSYSRFIVPISEINDSEVMRRMRNGPWPIGAPREFFSEEWWVEHAIWQMVARESRQYLDNLALRIGEFNRCGPP